MTSYQVQTGGKLYIAGEYAILNPGQTALLINIPIKMTGQIEDHSDFVIYSDMFDYCVGLEEDKNYKFIQAAIETMALFMGKKVTDLPAFKLTINGKMEANGKKYGIGSSGSVTVLTIKALAVFYNLKLTKDLIFKLASYTLLKLGDNGSMGDIACIAYDDLISYRSFDREMVKSWLVDKSFEEIIQADWHYAIQVIKPQLAMTLLVGWTKQPSISREMIIRVKSKINQSFLEKIEKATLICQKSLEAGDKNKFITSLESLSNLLNNLDQSIYHPKLRQLKEASLGLDSVAKSSGSGGGDCGIAFTFTKQAEKEIKTRWAEDDIELIYQKSWGTYD